MTDLLLKPEDTGDIPRVDAVGEGTRNLAPYVNGLPPTLRRSAADVPFYFADPSDGCRRIEPNDEDFVKPGQPGYPNPDPLPPPPPPKPSSMGEYRERRSVLYVMPTDRILGKGGRHRRPRRFEPLWSALESGLACVRRAF